MFRIIISILVMVVAGNSVSGQSAYVLASRIALEKGEIEGAYDVKTGLHTYFGIPYAQPPVGALRWKAPQPLAAWSGVKMTKAFGDRPAQGFVWDDIRPRATGMSEDCLYLNVWTPARRGEHGLPVLVYFHGGGFVVGDGSEPRYDGAAMAQQGIVVVTVNYRLGIFGFFAHPELSREASYKSSGNYGLLDQVASLEWVKKNIAAFGGDPSKVTIAGESAGSISVSLLMASPLSKGLIAGAIGESGSGIGALSAVSLAEAEKGGETFARSAGFTSLAQLRAASTKEIFEVYKDSKRFGFPTVIDGYFLPKALGDLYTAGEQASVPLLVGWNSAEMVGAAFLQGQPATEENFVAKVKEAYPTAYADVLTAYPHHTSKEVEWAATNLASDRFISYSTWKWFDTHRRTGKKNVYRYLYAKLRPPASTGPSYELIGAPHAAEIPYCMGNLSLTNDFKWTPDDYQVSDTMLKFFANFIKHGDPNGDKLPAWPVAKPTDDKPGVMVIDTQSATVTTDDARYFLLDKLSKK